MKLTVVDRMTRLRGRDGSKGKFTVRSGLSEKFDKERTNESLNDGPDLD